MRVAITADQLLRPNSGGIGTYTEQLIRAYGKAFDRPVVLSNKESWRNRGDVGSAGAHVSTLFPHRVGGRLWEREILLTPKSLHDLDVVHATSFHFPSIRRSRSGVSGPQLSVFVHDLAWKHQPEFFGRRGCAFHDRGLDRARTQARWVLVPSQRTARDLIDAGVADERIFVVGEGADHLPAPTSGRPVPEKPYLLTVSTIEPRKNLANLLCAYEIAKKGAGRAFPDLLVVGAKGWNGAGESARLPHVDGARFLGHVTPGVLADIYADAVGFVYVPHLEGFGLPPMEAMWAGIPVLASSAVPSVMESDRCPAITVESHDVDSLARSIARLVDDTALRADLVARGTRHVATMTWERVARRHHEAWLTLAHRTAESHASPDTQRSDS